MSQTDYSIKQAAALFACSPQTVQAWIKAGKIKAYQLGKRCAWRITAQEIERVRGEGLTITKGNV